MRRRAMLVCLCAAQVAVAKEYLAEHGHRFAIVTTDVRQIPFSGAIAACGERAQYVSIEANPRSLA